MSQNSPRKWIWETITSNARLIFPIFVVLMRPSRTDAPIRCDDANPVRND